MGRVMLSGVAPQMKAPVPGILASDLAVGSSVYLMENGVATEYLVVNQGKPSGSSLYDDSCDGMWLLRKDVYEKRKWHSSNVNDYENSTIHSYLNSTFFGLLGTVEKTCIKQVKIPYRAGSGVSKTIQSGSNGLNTRIFFLSSTEVGWIGDVMPSGEGAKLSYFSSCSTTGTDSKRVATLNGGESDWWLRTPECHSRSENYDVYVTRVYFEGQVFGGNTCVQETGVRPALVLPSNALFDKTTLLLKGVA